MGMAKEFQLGVENAVGAYATTVSSTLATSLIPIAVTGVTIYIFMMGWAIARGEVQNSMSSTIGKAFKISVICAIALGGGTYQSVVIEFINGIEGIFVAAIGGTNVQTGSGMVGQLIDNSIIPVKSLAGKLFTDANNGWIPNITLIVCGIIAVLAQILITIASLIPLLVAKVSVALLLAVGPAFVLLALFPATVRFTEAWLAATLAAVMTVIVIAAVVGFMPRFIAHYAGKMLTNYGTTNPIYDITALFIVALVLAWIAWRASEFGAQIIGGPTLGNPMGSLMQTLMMRFLGNRKPPPPPPPPPGGGGGGSMAGNPGTPLAQNFGARKKG